MTRPLRIAVDLLGAELPASELIEGAAELREIRPTCELLFICDSESIGKESSNGYQIVDCTNWVRDGESLRDILRERTRTSMHVGMHMLHDEKVDGFVSVGSTGALMALGRHILHTPLGIDRPAVIKEFDGKQLPFWMLDLGANIVRKPSTLLQFAFLGSAYASRVGGVERPRIALLNIGIEARKGPTLLREAAALLGAAKELNFVGFVEPSHIFEGSADVVVTDGYAGNIALKAVEGTVNFIRDVFFHELGSDDHGDAAQAIRKRARKRFRRLMRKLDSQRHNGGSFVGLNGVVVKSHNGTTAAGMTAAIAQAVREVEMGVPAKIQAFFEKG
ncbi:MAG: phosphate acyltransferase [Gammaproteobacteria bacterium]|nr:phosphate acyltransferase [Gammaproteobacteria bacterium]